MAKIRDIKNEVNYLTYEIISDCNIAMTYNPAKKGDILLLIDEAVAMRNKLIDKINNPGQISQAYFKAIKLELISTADSIFEKLRSIIK